MERTEKTKKITERITQNLESCKGCYLCLTACKKEALKISDYVNSKGLQVVEADQEKCIACGACFAICPDYVYELVPKEN